MRDGTAVPDRSDGWSGLLAQPGPITPTLRRDVPSFNVRLEGLGRRRFATSRDSKSDRTCQHSRSYLGPAIKRWTLREVSMYWGRCANGKKLAERASHGRKRMLTDGCDSFSVVTVKPSESFWEAWERIRTSADPDPLEVLQLAAAFSRYFIRPRRKQSRWRARLGCRGSRFASPSARADKPYGSVRAEMRHCRRCFASGKRRWEAVKRDPISWYGETKAFPRLKS